MYRNWVRAPLLALSLLSVIFSVEAKADVREVKDFRIHEDYRSIRALGMGDAFVAVAEDYNTLFYNPAGLANVTEPEINLSLGAAADSKFMKFYNDINSAAGSQDNTKIGNILAENYDNYYAARASLLQAVWVRPGWGLAVLPIDMSIDFSIHKVAAPALDLVSYQDTTIAWGRGWKPHWSPNHDISLGITAKAIYRAYYNRVFFASDLAAKDSKLLRAQDADEGMTADADLGFLWTPKLAKNSWWRHTKPTVGFVARNIIDYGFTSNYHLIDKDTSGEPAKLGRRFDLGTKFDLPDWWIWKVRAAADMKDMGHENFTVNKGFHAGAEFLWKIKSWWQGGWRLGVNQGYPTFGFSATFAFFSLDLVTFADEVGPSDRPKAVRTYALKASLDW
jgi:hypothetical protein